jgi:hypothetical protein
MSDYAQNPVFAADNIPYQVPQTTYYYRRLFIPNTASTASTLIDYGWAALASIGSAWAGLAWGRWLRRIRR